MFYLCGMTIIKKIFKTLFGHPVVDNKPRPGTRIVTDEKGRKWPISQNEIDEYLKYLIKENVLGKSIAVKLESPTPIVDKVADAPKKIEGKHIHNIPKWFSAPISSLHSPSQAEIKISEQLIKYPIKWYNEVSFEGFKTENGGYYRFDFYIPSLNILIEYDGEKYHSTKEAIAKDKIKTEFCKTYSIKLVRYNKQHYYNIDTQIAGLLKKHGIYKIINTHD